VREVSDPLTSLVKAIDQKVHEASGKYPRSLGTFVVIGDAHGRADQLRGLAKAEALQRVTLCIGAAPPRYEVSNDAEVTVVIYTPGRPGRQEVRANFALRQGELDETKHDAIVEALSKVLPK
jgi:hypothetical protein